MPLGKFRPCFGPQRSALVRFTSSDMWQYLNVIAERADPKEIVADGGLVESHLLTGQALRYVAWLVVREQVTQ